MPREEAAALVGGAARVQHAAGGFSYRALVLTVDAERGTADVLTTDAPETELTVELGSLSRLEPFEDGGGHQDEAAGVSLVETLKAEANTLYQRKDFAAASERYAKGLAALSEACTWKTKQTALASSSSSCPTAPALVLARVKSSTKRRACTRRCRRRGCPPRGSSPSGRRRGRCRSSPSR